jgi:hypothetical protein
MPIQSRRSHALPPEEPPSTSILHKIRNSSNLTIGTYVVVLTFFGKWHWRGQGTIGPAGGFLHQPKSLHCVPQATFLVESDIKPVKKQAGSASPPAWITTWSCLISQLRR